MKADTVDESMTAQIQVATFYRFVTLERVAELRARVEALGRRYGVLGTVLLATEGVNATVCGEPQALTRWQQGFRELHPGFAAIEFRHSWVEQAPFRRWRVRVRPEIVTMGIADIDPNEITGQHVAPQDWNALIRRPDVRVVDTRNHYEYQLGSFERAEDPETDHFRDFPAWVDAHLDVDKDQHVAMFCTGGIRCEKATAYLLQRGFQNVYQLDGGILEYLRATPAEDSLWRGECFIFDDRVTVDHNLAATGREVCCACRKPFPPDSTEQEIDEGICSRCLSEMTDRQLAGVRERMRQVRLAARRGRQHLGPQTED